MQAASSTLQMRSVPTDPNSTVMTPRSQSRVLWMTCIRVLVAMTLLLCMSEVSRAQSDDCSAPPPISGEGFFTYDATNASTTGFSGGGVCSPYISADVFWVWTPLVSGDYYFRTCSGGTDSEINLHLGGDCSATCLATADTGACAYEWTKATMRVDGLVAGQDHLLQLGSGLWGNLGGSIEVLLAPPIPTNDTCATPASIQGMGFFDFDRTSATSSGFGSPPLGLCTAGPIYEDVFFQWTAGQAGDYLFRDCTYPYTGDIWIYAGEDCNATCISGFDLSSCNGPGLVVPGVLAGDRFLIQAGRPVSLHAIDLLPGQFEITLAPPPPPNDTCSTPLDLVGLGIHSWDNTHARTSRFEGGGAPCSAFPAFLGITQDVFYHWVVPSDGSYLFEASAGAMNNRVAIHVGPNCSALCLATSGPLSSALYPNVTGSDLQAGDSILIQVGGSGPGADFGEGWLRIDEIPSTVSNKDCANPQSVPTLQGEAEVVWYPAIQSSSGFQGGDPVLCPYIIPFFNDPQPIQNDLFFTWTPNVSRPFRIRAEGFLGSMSSVLAVHLGSDCSATCLGQAGATSQTNSELILTPSACQTYLIQVGFDWGVPPQPGYLIFELVDPSIPSPIELICPPTTVHHEGAAVSLTCSSIGSDAGSGLTLKAVLGPTEAFGFFLVSAGANQSMPLFNGTLCLDAPIGRYSQRVANDQGLPQLASIGRFDASGTFQNLSGTATSNQGAGFEVPLELPFSPGGATIQPGDTWHFQLWYRDDPISPATGANLSDVLQATF